MIEITLKPKIEQNIPLNQKNDINTSQNLKNDINTPPLPQKKFTKIPRKLKNEQNIGGFHYLLL